MRASVLLLAAVLAGCLAPAAPIDVALPMSLPGGDYYAATYAPGRGYHTLDELHAQVDAVAAADPALARVAILGESREGRPVRALVLAEGEGKRAAFLDAGHHANEVEGIELMVYLADFLVRNQGNATVRDLLRDLEVWIVPVVNPDGYVAQTRFNAAGVNLNRNYDLDWCSPTARNTCPPGPVHDALRPFTGPTPENAGTGPFSEPESSAVRDAVLGLGDRLAFYVSHHTPAHCLARPWTAPNPPHPVPADHLEVFEAVFGYVTDHTEYGAGTWTTPGGTCMDYQAGGTSQDWVYATAGVPSFTMEVAGDASWEGINPVTALALPPSDFRRDLAYWAAATLPIDLFLLHNAARLQAWDPALEEPLLPEGVGGAGHDHREG